MLNTQLIEKHIKGAVMYEVYNIFGVYKKYGLLTEITNPYSEVYKYEFETSKDLVELLNAYIVYKECLPQNPFRYNQLYPSSLSGLIYALSKPIDY